MDKNKNEFCDIHQSDITEMKKDISLLKVKLDDFIESVKPNITIKDKLTFLVGVIIYTVIVSTSFNTVDNRSKNNKERIDKMENKIDKIYDLVYDMNQRVR